MATETEIASLKDKIKALREAKEASADDDEQTLLDCGAENTPLNMKPRRTLKGHFGKVYAIHWGGSESGAPGSHKLVSASQDGKLIVWNATNCNKMHAIPLRSSWVMTCAFERSENKFVACGGLDNLCSIYPVGADESATKASSELAHHDGYLSCCRFSDRDANEILTSSGDSTCILWDISTDTPKMHFARHKSDVMSVAISPTDPNVFVSGSCDSSCISWDMRTGKPNWTFTGHESDINSVDFFPDGRSFGTGSDDASCRMFDMRSCSQIRNWIDDHILCGVTSVAFTMSGRYLCSGYDDYTMSTWDVLTKQMKSSKEHENRVSCIGLQHGGAAIATGSWDTILKVWA